jgi:hypothetical protein
LSYEIRVRRAAELDIAEAQVWYESQQSGLGAEFRTEISLVFERLAETPLIYQKVHGDVRRATVRPHSLSDLVPRERRDRDRTRLQLCWTRSQVR